MPIYYCTPPSFLLIPFILFSLYKPRQQCNAISRIWPGLFLQETQVGQVPMGSDLLIFPSAGCGCTRIRGVCCSSICSPPVPAMIMLLVQSASYLNSHPVLFLISLSIRGGESIHFIYTPLFAELSSPLPPASNVCSFYCICLQSVLLVHEFDIFLHW